MLRYTYIVCLVFSKGRDVRSLWNIALSIYCWKMNMKHWWQTRENYTNIQWSPLYNKSLTENSQTESSPPWWEADNWPHEIWQDHSDTRHLNQQNNITLKFYVLLTVHLYIILYIKPTWCTLFSVYRVIHKSLRNFRTRLRNNQERKGRKEHINRYRISQRFFCTRGLGVLAGSTARG